MALVVRKDGGPPYGTCKRCGSDIEVTACTWIWFGQRTVLGCINPTCKNYYAHRHPNEFDTTLLEEFSLCPIRMSKEKQTHMEKMMKLKQEASERGTFVGVLKGATK